MNHTKPKGLPDAPQPAGADYGDAGSLVANGPRLYEFLREMYDQVLSHYDVLTVGEMPSATPASAIKYAGLDAKELNMVFQFEHVGLASNPDPRLGKWYDQPIPLLDLKKTLSRWQTALDGKGWNSLYWNNHDQPRAVSRFASDDPKYRVPAAKMLAATLHMMQGTPYIYEGEELGMTNGHFTKLSQYEDLESLNAYRELVDEEKLVGQAKMLKYLAHRSRDNARTPMQWDGSKNAGFSQGQPWYALNANYPQINAAASLADPESVFYYYQKLIALRHEYDLISLGDFEEIDSHDDKAFAYFRHYQGQRLLLISNFTQQTIRRDYNQQAAKKLLIANYPDSQKQPALFRPYENKVFLY